MSEIKKLYERVMSESFDVDIDETMNKDDIVSFKGEVQGDLDKFDEDKVESQIDKVVKSIYGAGKIDVKVDF